MGILERPYVLDAPEVLPTGIPGRGGRMPRIPCTSSRSVLSYAPSGLGLQLERGRTLTSCFQLMPLGIPVHCRDNRRSASSSWDDTGRVHHYQSANV